jgi:hypothetical protein
MQIMGDIIRDAGQIDYHGLSQTQRVARIAEALAITCGSCTRAAEIVGITRQGLHLFTQRHPQVWPMAKRINRYVRRADRTRRAA